jgi:quercetin dioxygenase-like cupin family protein
LTNETPTVHVTRLYALADGGSSMEEIELPLDKLYNGRGVQFVHVAGDEVPYWHRAPRRQFTTTIFGEGEIETTDGKVVQVRPGVILLLEDTVGTGHLTRHKTARTIAFIHLDEDTVIP